MWRQCTDLIKVWLLSYCTWNKGYYKYMLHALTFELTSTLCTGRERAITRKEMISILLLWTFHLCVTTFLYRLHMNIYFSVDAIFKCFHSLLASPWYRIAANKETAELSVLSLQRWSHHVEGGHHDLRNICERDHYGHVPFIIEKLRPFLSLVHDLLLNMTYHQTFNMSYTTSALVEHLSW